MNEIKGGLLPLTKDEKDLNLGEIVTLPSLSELPKKFSLGDTVIRNQEADGNNDFCTAYGTVGMAYLQDGIEGSPEWVFAASKVLSGNPEEFGKNMRDAFKTWVKYGSPRREDVKIPEKPNARRYFENYASLSGDELKKETYVTTKGQYDAFDNIRASIYRFRNEKRAVGIGVVFGWPLSQEILTGTPEGGFGHFMFATGWDGQYLEVVNSYGKEAGKNGKHLLSRETINYFVGRYGAFMLIDLPVETARDIVRKKKRNWLLDLICKVWNFIKDIFSPWMWRDLGVARRSGWRQLRNDFFRANPLCAMCGNGGKQVHHVQPVWKFPEHELNWENLITLCKHCHLKFAHLGSYRSYCLEIKELAAEWKKRRE